MRALPIVLALLAVAPAASAFVALPPGTVPVPVSSDLDSAKVYPTYPILTEELADLAVTYKDIARLHSAGTSAKGLELWYMEVADFENPNRTALSGREVLYIDGGTHANEYIGVIFVMHTLRWLLEGYGTNETATWIVENRHTYILPLVNPEGSMNGVGRLNDNAVNINRNFPVGWGDVAETPVVNNPGPYPVSEKETQAITNLWAKIAPDYILSIHCCGNLWLYPYGIEGRDPHVDDHTVFTRICDEVLFDVREQCGPTWSTIYPASGITSDSGYELTGATSFTFEMSGREAGAFPWGPPAYTTAIEELEKESWRAVQHAFANVHLYGAYPVVAVESIDAGGVRLRVTNDGYANLTRAIVSVADANRAIQSTTVPRLLPGESAVVAVAGAFAPGTFAVDVTYGKRPLGGEGLFASTLAVVAAGEGLAGSIGTLEPAGSEVTEKLPTPFGGVALLGLAAVGALWLRRRT